MSDKSNAGDARSRFGSVVHRTDRPGRYYVVFEYQGRRIKRSAGATWAEADKKRRQARVLLEDQLVPLADVLVRVFGDEGGSALTFREAGPHYLAYAATRKKASTLAVDTVRLAAILRAPWTADRLANIRPDVLLRWVNGRTTGADAVSVATANRDLALVSAVFRWAIGAGYATDNPARRVDRFSEKGRERETHLTAAEARALVACADDRLRPVLVVALSTGMRRGELLALQWRDVDATAGRIRVRPESEKTGRGREVPMTADVAATLAGLRKSRTVVALDGTDPVFRSRGLKPMRRSTLATLLESAASGVGAVLAGGGDPSAVEAWEAKRPRVTFHALRHTAASIMVAAGVPILDVARILGHSTVAVTMRYAHFAPESGRSAIRSLGGALALGVAAAPAPTSAASAS